MKNITYHTKLYKISSFLGKQIFYNAFFFHMSIHCLHTFVRLALLTYLTCDRNLEWKHSLIHYAEKKRKTKEHKTTKQNKTGLLLYRYTCAFFFVMKVLALLHFEIKFWNTMIFINILSGSYLPLSRRAMFWW